MTALLEPTSEGLYCTAGDFYIDPWRPVPHAVITHAHADHAGPGCESYLVAERGAALLRERLGPEAQIETLAYGRTMRFNEVALSLHPAGHVLGSAQVRVERGGEVWAFTGDYKRQRDATCEPFEPLRCHTLITESTYGLPIFRWRAPEEVFAEINAWWAANQALGRTSVLFAYAIGKAQRVLAGLDPGIGPILVHGAVARFLPAYEAAGVRLAATEHGDSERIRRERGRALVIAPPSAAGSPWLRKLGETSTAFASGWMQIRGTRRRRNLDRGFVLSDHADWNDLLETIRESGAEMVGVTHGYAHVLARWLEEQGQAARVVPTQFEGESGED